MKIFDYKLILLIVLTFVIYFMYREIQKLNERIESIEKNVTSPPKQLEQTALPKFINFQPTIPENNNISYDQNLKTDLNNILPNDSCSISTEEENDEEYTNNTNIKENVVEIYSNDNIESISSQITSDSNMNNDTDKIVTRLVSTLSPNNSFTLSSSSISPISPIDKDEILMKTSIEEIEFDKIEQTDQIQADQIQTDPIQADPIQAENIQADQIQADQIQTDPIQTDQIQVDPAAYLNISDDNTDEPICKFIPDDFIKNNKLNALKKIATELEIELRKENGKNKTKKELATDICIIKNKK